MTNLFDVAVERREQEREKLTSSKDMVEEIADKLLEDHMGLMLENQKLREQLDAIAATPPAAPDQPSELLDDECKHGGRCGVGGYCNDCHQPVAPDTAATMRLDASMKVEEGRPAGFSVAGNSLFISNKMRPYTRLSGSYPLPVGWWVLPGSVGNCKTSFACYKKPNWLVRHAMQYVFGWKYEEVK